MIPQKTILLVRHGQTDNSRPPDDKLGNGLTALGIEQARLTGRRLAGRRRVARLALVRHGRDGATGRNRVAHGEVLSGCRSRGSTDRKG